MNEVESSEFFKPSRALHLNLFAASFKGQRCNFSVQFSPLELD